MGIALRLRSVKQIQKGEMITLRVTDHQVLQSFSKINMGDYSFQSLKLSRTSIQCDETTEFRKLWLKEKALRSNLSVITLRVTDPLDIAKFERTCVVIPERLPQKPSNWRPVVPRCQRDVDQDTLSSKLASARRMRRSRSTKRSNHDGIIVRRPPSYNQKKVALAKYLSSLVQ